MEVAVYNKITEYLLDNKPLRRRFYDLVDSPNTTAAAKNGFMVDLGFQNICFDSYVKYIGV